MILVTVKNSKTGSQYICKSASKTVKYISYKHISFILYVDTESPVFLTIPSRFKGCMYRIGTVQGNRSPKRAYHEYTYAQTTGANYHGNTPRRSY